jgi:hypothetical protein
MVGCPRPDRLFSPNPEKYCEVSRGEHRTAGRGDQQVLRARGYFGNYAPLTGLTRADRFGEAGPQ